MSLEREVAIVRGGAGLTLLEHVALLRVSGNDAFELVSSLSSRRLFLREGQMSHTLLLADDGRILADAYVSSAEDGAYYVFAEGPSEAELLGHVARVQRERHPGADVTFEGLSAGHELVGLNGPYAWEALSAVFGPIVLGMPYLTLLTLDEVMCFRAGKTGEYGYDLLIPRSASAAMASELARQGEAFGLARVGVAALDQCALENWHFNVRMLNATRLVTPLTPLELQLQWRVSCGHDAVGSKALVARKIHGVDWRATLFTAEAELRRGDEVHLGDQLAGEVLAANWSFTCKSWLGVALLASPIAHPGIELRAGADRGIRIRTRTPPVVNNRSLHVDPHRHSYKTRELDEFPPLVVNP